MYCRVSCKILGTASGESTTKSYQSDNMYASSVAIRAGIIILITVSVMAPFSFECKLLFTK
jgi:hypothetical protein